ncbi:DUF1661 domain-containing protein [Porphyromonas gulae]|uniref:DUF1661 domain-containing protein n=1 Tax=Porphyromonas gulae TaxID=111105 RepID=UPI00068BA1D6
MPFLKTWRDKNSALARDFFKTRTKTKKFWRDFFKIATRLSDDFWRVNHLLIHLKKLKGRDYLAYFVRSCFFKYSVRSIMSNTNSISLYWIHYTSKVFIKVGDFYTFGQQ